MSEPLADLLGRYFHRSRSSINRIAELSGVPKQTIANWLERRIKKPRRWQDVVKVAMALHLSVNDTNALLKAAGHLPIAQLLPQAAGTDRALLEPFEPPTVQRQSTPFQAISDLPNFVGRNAELRELEQTLLNQGRAAICGVHGMGGVGKTTLAAHLAYLVRDEFPDGVLWARVDTSESLTILAQFADAFGKDVRDYHDVESRSAVVRSILSDKRVLIILDNAESSEQVRHLLPPSTGRTAVLITTRNDLSVLDGWSRLALHPFDTTSNDALDLFTRYLGSAYVTQAAAALDAIAATVGHLPFALAIIAGQLQARPEITAHDLLAQLRQSDTRLSLLTREDRNLRTSFEVSYVALRAELQRLFVMLGVFGGEDFSVEAVAYAADLSQDEAAAQLAALQARSLIQPNRAERWRLHPLLRDYAREKLAGVDADRAYTRLLEFYIHRLNQSSAAGYAALSADVDNIAYALEKAYTHHWSALYTRGASAVVPMYDALGLYAKLEALIPKVVQTADTLDDAAIRARWLYQLAGIEIDHQLRPALADDHAQQALTLARQTNDWLLTCNILILRSRIAWAEEAVDRAAALMIEAETLAHHHQLESVLARVSRDRGWRALWQGDFDLAEAKIRAELARVRHGQNVHEIRSTLNGLGYVLHRRGQYAEADACYAESLTISEQANGVRPSHTLRARAENAVAWGKLAAADQYASEALERARQSGKPDEVIDAQIYAGDVALARTEFSRARELWQASYQLTQNLSPMKHYAVVCRLGRLYLEQNQLSQAEYFLQDADTWTQGNDHNDSLRWYLCFDLARLALKHGRLAEAECYAEESLARCKKLKLRETAEAQALLDQIRTERASRTT